MGLGCTTIKDKSLEVIGNRMSLKTALPEKRVYW